VSSSLWNGLKAEYHNVLDNSFWLIGNGKKVSFWSDNATLMAASPPHLPLVEEFSEMLVPN